LNTSISVEVSPGELIDKITILEVKLERIKDADKLANVKLDWETLSAARDAAIEPSGELERLSAELKQANERLWRIEDDIRDCERNKDFGDAFVELSRGVYKTNDKRAALKREINELLGSSLIEEKSYAAY
jgi:post-segregation antitoxin (ccd killing protein)